MFNKFPGERTLLPNIEKPTSNATSPIGNSALFKKTTAFALTAPETRLGDTSVFASNIAFPPASDFVECDSRDHDQSKKDRLKAGVDMKKVQSVRKDR
jgi:hypothetical protein